MQDYIIMHLDKEVASLSRNGECDLRCPEFMPYNLYLEEGAGTDIQVNNITNFRYWCATRMLTLDREHAKAILNSIGASQSMTDATRAEIALSYHCLTLTDVFWVKKSTDTMSFDEINLYENHLDNAFVDIALRGKQMTVANAYLIADDISTTGLFPKAWVREKDGSFRLYKDGDRKAVEMELLASSICECFDCPQVRYVPAIYEGVTVSACKLISSREYGLVTREAFDIYARNHDIDPIRYILDLDADGYHMMNILDYLVGNTDRHWANWGLLIDNKTNRPIRLHELMDFNRAFDSYDTEDGANCETAFPERITQKEAAIRGVKSVGLKQIREVPPEVFGEKDGLREMFFHRLSILRSETDIEE